MLKKVRKKENESKLNSEGVFRATTMDDEMDLFLSSRKTVKELIAPNGVNPNPLDHMIIDDNGEELYTMCFYIDKLPKNPTFASTFSVLFNFPGVTSSVFVDPLVAGKSQKMLDRRVVILDTERRAAEKGEDRNKFRKISAKLQDAEKWASDIEAGDNMLFEVAFLFTLQATDQEKLRLMASDFHMRGREKGIELSSCYGAHPEAFVSGYPTNRIFKAKKGIISSLPVKKHIFDKRSLSTIFNHTRSDFSHKKGIPIGRNIFTGQPVTFDIYNESHNGYGCVIVGITGTGKSATVKMFLSRYIDFDYYVRSIDFEPRGNRGEYSMMAEKVGGVNFQIKQNSNNILNLFEIQEEIEYDEISGTEYPTLKLAQKISDARKLLMIMIKNGREIDDFAEGTFIERIVTDTISELYNRLEIYDQQVDSLFTNSKTFVNGKITAGKKRKELPTISDFFKLVLQKQKMNLLSNDDASKFYLRPYQIIIDAMKDYVKEIIYCPECLKFYTKEEYDTLPVDKDGNKVCGCNEVNRSKVIVIRGVKSYYDGQSTVMANTDTPHINIDISQLPESDRTIALLIALNFMQENYIKKNSTNIKKAKKMIVLIDELHKTFKSPEARIFVSDVYRTARKRNVSPWTVTQNLADYKGYEETEGIIKSAACIFMLKQDFQDRDFIKQTTPLTDSQVEQVLNQGGDPNDPEKARRGEACLIDNGRVVFLKVDYLKDSEAMIVETDLAKLQAIYKGTKLENMLN